VALTNGFVPTLGDEFPILTCASFNGSFSALNLPSGLVVSYRGTGVFLVATNVARVTAQSLSHPAVAGTDLCFSFQSVDGRSYTVEFNNDLGTTNWIAFTNLTGNGSVMRVHVPVTNAPKRFFRVREP